MVWGRSSPRFSAIGIQVVSMLVRASLLSFLVAAGKCLAIPDELLEPDTHSPALVLCTLAEPNEKKEEQDEIQFNYDIFDDKGAH